MKCGESERRCNNDGCFRMDDDYENTNRDARHGSARVHPVRNSIREWVEERVGGECEMGNAAKQSSDHEEKTVRLAHTYRV